MLASTIYFKEYWNKKNRNRKELKKFIRKRLKYRQPKTVKIIDFTMWCNII